MNNDMTSNAGKFNFYNALKGTGIRAGCMRCAYNILNPLMGTSAGCNHPNVDTGGKDCIDQNHKFWELSSTGMIHGR